MCAAGSCAGVMSVTAPGMPAQLVVSLPPSALAAAQSLTHPNPAPAPAGKPALPLPHASEAALPGARSGASLRAAQPGSLRLSRTGSGAAEPASPGLRSAKSGTTEPPSPCFSASSRSRTESRDCQPHLNPVLWPRARRLLQALDPVSKTANPDLSSAEPPHSFGGATAREAASIAEKRTDAAAGDQQLGTIRVCADSVCGLQVRGHAALYHLLKASAAIPMCRRGRVRVLLHTCMHMQRASRKYMLHSAAFDVLGIVSGPMQSRQGPAAFMMQPTQGRRVLCLLFNIIISMLYVLLTD